jgi:clan AA aspartic protease (TIGR02281 family)
METYISFDPAKRRTTQYTKLISEFADKGNCDAKYARGSAHISRLPRPGMSGTNTLVVVVNGVTGNFLLDTGATYVAVTPVFATKAKISTEAATQLPIKTVGGITNADLGYATTVSVGNAEARSVAVAVIRGADPFGGRLDGLLGMSFLARFKVGLSQDGIDLTAIPLR